MKFLILCPRHQKNQIYSSAAYQAKQLLYVSLLTIILAAVGIRPLWCPRLDSNQRSPDYWWQIQELHLFKDYYLPSRALKPTELLGHKIFYLKVKNSFSKANFSFNFSSEYLPFLTVTCLYFAVNKLARYFFSGTNK